MDPSLLKEIPPEVHVERVFTPEIPFEWRNRLWKQLSSPKAEVKNPQATQAKSALKGPARWVKRLLSPDPQIVWTPLAVRAADRLVRAEGIQTVIVTVPPFSALRVGMELKRRFPALTLISDFRDEWLDFYLGLAPGERSPLRDRAAQIERQCVELSDYVTTVTSSWRDIIRARYPEQPDSKFLCVCNGYDPAVFANFRSRPHGTDRIVVTYFGTVYDGYNSPVPFLQAADRLPEDTARKIEARFLGRVEGDQERNLTLQRGVVKPLGFLPHAKALELLEETDFLLLPVDSATTHSGKLFEYLASAKPILALTPPHGEVARIIRETGTGWVADPADPSAVDRMLREAIDAVRAGRFSPNREAIRAYERPSLVRRLVVQAGFAGSPSKQPPAPTPS
jgi:glycosyltransferase involved in cell wall biosynthesis